jgi:hypothetical protein
VSEEIDFKLNRVNLKLVDTLILKQFQYYPIHVFSYHIPFLQVDNLLNNINAMILQNKGEMSCFTFMPLNNCCCKLNQKSFWSLRLFKKKFTTTSKNKKW